MAVTGHGFSVFFMERIVFVIMCPFLYNRSRNLKQRRFLYMEEKSNVTKLTQKDYQKKYDEKTQSVTIKYTPADMSDYNRMMRHLESTGKSRSSFIKELINDFFEKNEEDVIGEYYQSYNVDDEHLQKLKNLLGDEKYKIVMDIHADAILSDLSMTFEEYGIVFEEWIDQLEDDIKCGDMNINIPDEEFKRMIDKHLCNSIGTICYN